MSPSTSSAAEQHLVRKLTQAPLVLQPFPHFFVEGAFPDDYYREMRAMLPDPEAMVPLASVRPIVGAIQYKERFVQEFSDAALDALPPEKREFWLRHRAWMLKGATGRALFAKFQPFLARRFAGKTVTFYEELMLVRDVTNYSLGPHSDSPRKVITVLFYLPGDLSQRHLGTSIYVPRDRSFPYESGPHYFHDEFERVGTMPFMPNSVFVFLKNEASFHGVEPVRDAATQRWLLLYDIFHQVQ